MSWIKRLFLKKNVVVDTSNLDGWLKPNPVKMGPIFRLCEETLKSIQARIKRAADRNDDKVFRKYLAISEGLRATGGTEASKHGQTIPSTPKRRRSRRVAKKLPRSKPRKTKRNN